jgi:hypothetical protein
MDEHLEAIVASVREVVRVVRIQLNEDRHARVSLQRASPLQQAWM